MRGVPYPKTRGQGADERRKQARAAKSEEMRLAADREQATEKWKAHYDEMDALEAANKDLTDEIDACNVHTQEIKHQTNNLEFEVAAQRAVHEAVMQERNELNAIGQQWVNATLRQRDTIERLRQEITQAQRDIVCQEERYSRDKCEVHLYRDELHARRSQASHMRAEANAEELLANEESSEAQQVKMEVEDEHLRQDLAAAALATE